MAGPGKPGPMSKAEAQAKFFDPMNAHLDKYPRQKHMFAVIAAQNGARWEGEFVKERAQEFVAHALRPKLDPDLT